MEYIFGTKDDDQVILKTKGGEHSNLRGRHELERKYPDQTITDHFLILEKYDSAEDEEGNCYDWYIIDQYYRYTDKTGTVQNEVESVVGAMFPTENEATASQPYVKGKYFYHNGDFCKAKVNIAKGAQFTLNTNYEVTTISAELFSVLNS